MAKGVRNSSESNRRNNAKQTSKVREFLASIKTKGCVLCGYRKCLMALEFHHVGADKEYAVSDTKRSLVATMREVAKCVCVCANCHREIHAGMIEGINHVQTRRVDSCQVVLRFDQ